MAIFSCVFVFLFCLLSLFLFFCFFYFLFFCFLFFFFFFQAEDGIRDHCVTGVQTCALPISAAMSRGAALAATEPFVPSCTSSSAAFSGPRTTTLGVPCAAASTTTSP